MFHPETRIQNEFYLEIHRILSYHLTHLSVPFNSKSQLPVWLKRSPLHYWVLIMLTFYKPPSGVVSMS